MSQTSLRPEVPGPPLIGRSGELGVLRGALDTAIARGGSLLLIAGEAGSGKTRLVEVLAEDALGAGCLVLRGRCFEGAADAPYAPFTDLLDAAAQAVPLDALRDACAGLTAVFQLCPALRAAAAGPVFDYGDRGADTPAEVCELLLRLARQAPLLAVIEDLQWAEAPAVLLLRRLAQSLSGSRLLVAATVRDDELSLPGRDDGNATRPALALLADAPRLPACVVQVGPLDENTAAELARSVCGAEFQGAQAAAFHSLTDGIPLYIEALAGEFVEHWQNTLAEALPLPGPVALAAARPFAHLSQASLRTLASAAVIGRTFDYRLLKAVTGATDEALLDCLDEAEQARIIVSEAGREPRLTFRREVVRRALLNRISLPRRQRLHAMTLAAIEEDGVEGRWREAARHSLLAGAAVGREATIGYLLRAAEQEAEDSAFEESLRLYREALALARPGDDAARCDLLLGLGLAEKRVSDSDEARAAFREAAALARKLKDRERLARAALGFARSWPTVGAVDAPAVALLREAAAAFGDDVAATKAEVLSRLSLQLYYQEDTDEVKALSALAVATARKAGDPVALARCLQVRHVTLWEPQHLAERLEVSREIIDIAKAKATPAIALWGLRPRISDLTEAGDLAGSEHLLEEYVRVAAEVRQPIFIWQAAVRRAMLAIFRGRLVEGERLAGEAMNLGLAAQGQNLMAAYGEQMLVVRWLQGRLGELEGLASASLERQPGLALWRSILAFICAETGKRQEARRHYETLAADGFALLPTDDTRPIAVVFAGLTCATLGDAGTADFLYRELLPRDGLNIVLSEGVVSIGAAAGYLGLLAATAGRLDDAERHFEDAIALNSRSGGRPWLAHSQLEYGRMLLARRRPGDRRRALALLVAARAGAAELGMTAAQDQAARLLNSHRGLAEAYPDGLTRREVEVLRLLAAGRSNKEISDALVLSLRTTARHVTNIYGKIGARNRADATAYAIRHNLLED